MVNAIPDPPEGLLQGAWDLARHAEWTRAEIEKGDVWMAHAHTFTTTAGETRSGPSRDGGRS